MQKYAEAGSNANKPDICAYKNKNGPKSESRAVFIIRINNLDYCTLLAE